MKTHKALLLQLPLQSHDFFYSLESFSLAQGYLVSYAKWNCPDWEIEILPQGTSHFAGDLALIQSVVRERPDLVGFTCYLWNIERTLHIAGEIKQNLPGCFIVLGGPEITGDNLLLQGSTGFDIGVVGEGEETFSRLLTYVGQSPGSLEQLPGLLIRNEARWIQTPRAKQIVNLERIPSPYLEGVIGTTPLESMAIETARGCPFLCLYCYYHKSYSKVRSFGLARLKSELLWAAEHGVKEISILDPSFDYSPHFDQVLGILKEARSHARFEVFCEMVAHHLEKSTIRDMAKAGIRKVEIGIQSTNPRTLRKIGRPVPPRTLGRSFKTLRDEGIKMIIDLIVGLPGDDVNTIQRTVDFVVGQAASDNVMVHPLSVLPGTELRMKSRELGVNFMALPPYYVLETPTMSRGDLYRSFEYCEKALGVDLFPTEYPVIGEVDRPQTKKAPYVTHLVLGNDGETDFSTLPAAIAQSITILVKKGEEDSFEEMLRRLDPIFSQNPFCLANWVFMDSLQLGQAISKTLMGSFRRMEHLMDREIFGNRRGMRSLQFFLFGEPKKWKRQKGEFIRVHLAEFSRVDMRSSPSRLWEEPVSWISFAKDARPSEVLRFMDRLRKRSPDGPDIHFWDLGLEARWNPFFPSVRFASLASSPKSNQVIHPDPPSDSGNS